MISSTIMFLKQAGTMLDVPINYGVIDPDIGTVLSFSMDCPPFSVESNTGFVFLR